MFFTKIILNRKLFNILRKLHTDKKNTNNLISVIENYNTNDKLLLFWGYRLSIYTIKNYLQTFLYNNKEPLTCLEEAALSYIILKQLGKSCTLKIAVSKIPAINFHAWTECEGEIFFTSDENMTILKSIA